MKGFFTIAFCSIAILFSSFITLEENKVQEVLKNFQKQYDKEEVSMDYLIQYKTHTNKVETLEKGKVYYTNTCYYNKRGNEISFIDNQYELTINEGTNSIVLENSSLTSFKTKTSRLSIDSIIKALEKEELISMKTTSDEFLLSHALPSYSIVYHFDKKTYNLLKIEYFFKQDREYKSMTVGFTNILFNKSIPTRYNSYKQFITIKRKGVRGKGLYKSYLITDQRTRK